MIDFIFWGQESFFGDMPDLVCKSFSGNKIIESGVDVRTKFINISDNQICFISLDDHSISEIFENLNFLKENLLFLVGEQKSFKAFEDLFEKHKLQLAGFIDIKSSPSIYLSLVNNSYKYLSLKLKMNEVVSLGKDLNELASKTIEESNKLKEIHREIVPIRHVETKGMNIFSKFSAGTSPGGEFFDYSIEDGLITLVLISTSSYIVTSYFLTYVSMVKKQATDDDLKNFIETVNNEIKSLGIEDDKSSLLFLNIDTKKMHITGYNFGGHQILSSKEMIIDSNDYPVDYNFAEKSHFEHQLSRGEKIYLLSKGMRANGQKNKIPLSEIINPKSEMTIEEEFNEAFFQLKKSTSSKFLEYDATMVLLKVDENAIFSI